MFFIFKSTLKYKVNKSKSLLPNLFSINLQSYLHIMALTHSSLLDKYASYWLGAILVVALGLRLFHLDTHGIFFDEKSTMVVSQGIVLDGANQKMFLKRGSLYLQIRSFGVRKSARIITKP
jgi:hypothetical protein